MHVVTREELILIIKVISYHSIALAYNHQKPWWNNNWQAKSRNKNIATNRLTDKIQHYKLFKSNTSVVSFKKYKLFAVK